MTSVEAVPEPAAEPAPGELGARSEVLVVTGMSGAGRSSAARALEDLGWFVIDNLPPQLLPQTLDVIATRSDVDQVAVVVDARGGRLFDQLEWAMVTLLDSQYDLKVLFLDCSDDVLVRRFESNRRPHPLQDGGRLLDGIHRERALLGNVRATADLVIDTSLRNVHDLRRAVQQAFAEGEPARLRATVMSFGFKYGIPVDADFVADVRFLPNPYWVPGLRDLRGTDAAVNDYVVEQPGAAEFLDTYAHLIDLVADGYLREGKRFVTLAVGCTGGKHRSVAMVENLAARLVKVGLEASTVHRDLGRE